MTIMHGLQFKVECSNYRDNMKGSLVAMVL